VTIGAGGRSLEQMPRLLRIVSVLLLAMGALAGALGAGSSAAARPARRTAVVAGYVQLCGGPAPGRCWKGELGVCEAPKGCVTTHRVAAVNTSGRRVATHRLHRGRFRFRLAPGRYTILLLGDGRRVHGRVMGRQKVWARAHRTVHVQFNFDVP
jgi:hypothetical protein